MLGSDLKLVEVRARPPLTTPLPLKYPTPYAFPMAGVAETRKPPRLRGLSFIGSSHSLVEYQAYGFQVRRRAYQLEYSVHSTSVTISPCIHD